MSETSKELHFSINYDLLNTVIKEHLSEGRIADAYEIAKACVDSDPDSIRKLGVINAVLNEQLKFESDSEASNIVNVVETGYGSETGFLDRIKDLETQLAEYKQSNKIMLAKLQLIYDEGLRSYPLVLRWFCIKWMQNEVCMNNGEFLFPGGVSIPPEVLDACKRDTNYWEPFHKSDTVDLEIEEDTQSYDPVGEYIKAQKLDKEIRYGWLKPDGQFFDTPWGEHESWAKTHIENEHGSLDDYPYLTNIGDILVNSGWVLIHNPMHGTGRCTISKSHKLTMEQKKFIEDYYKDLNEDGAADAVKHNCLTEFPKYFDLI